MAEPIRAQSKVRILRSLVERGRRVHNGDEGRVTAVNKGNTFTVDVGGQSFVIDGKYLQAI